MTRREHGETLRVVLMLVLTFVTGVTDAVGYLALDKVFTGNMTGNIVVLGMALAGAPGLHVAGPAFALVAFAVGAWAAGMILRSTGKTWGVRHTTLLVVGGVIMGAVAVVITVMGGEVGLGVASVLAPAIAITMGSQAMIARHLAVRDMTTVVVTSTLVSLAGESFAGGGRGAIWNRRLGAIAVILVGAAAGAAALRWGAGVPVAAAAVLTIVVAIVGHRRWA